MRPARLRVLRLLAIPTTALVATVAMALPATASDDPSTGQVVAQVASAVGDAGAAAPAANPQVQVPSNGDGQVSVDGAGGSVSMTMPADGQAAGSQAGTTVYDGDAQGTSLAVQPLADGLRTLVSINSPDAPEDYSFQLGGSVARLALNDDGSVTGYDADDQPVATLDRPWAVDANGVSRRTTASTARH